MAAWLPRRRCATTSCFAHRRHGQVAAPRPQGSRLWGMVQPSLDSWHTSVYLPSPCRSRMHVSRRNSSSPGSESRSHCQSDPVQGALPEPNAPVACPSVRLQGHASPSRSPTSDRGGPLRFATARATVRGPSPRALASFGSTASALEVGRRHPRATSFEGELSLKGRPWAHSTDTRFPNCLFGSPIRSAGDAWVFQCWFRNVAGTQATSDFSDAVWLRLE